MPANEPGSAARPAGWADIAARTLVTRQRIRNRIFVVVAATAAMLDAGIVVFLAAAGTRAVDGAAAAGALVALFAAISYIHAARSPGKVSGRPASDEEAAVLGPMVERLAVRLKIEVPAIFIADDWAVNAFSAYSGRWATMFYTEGFLAEFDLARDQPLIETVTAHLLARAAAGDNAVTVAAAGLLNWALFLFNTVAAGLAYVLGKLGIAYIKSDAHKRLKPGPPPYGDDMINRLIVWGISIFIGLWLLMAAVVVLLIGGILVAVAGGVRMGLSRQRIRIADSIALEMAGDPQALGAAFARFAGIDRPDGRPVDLASRKRVLHELCFHDSSRYFPALAGRAAATSDSAGSAKPGALAPVASGLALVCLLAGVAILTTRIPYGHPFGTAVAAGRQHSTSTARTAPRLGAPTGGTQTGQQTQPGPGQSTTSQPSPTTSQSPRSQSPRSQSPSPQSSSAPPPDVPPATPANVTASANGQYQITVNWTAGSGDATGFNIDNGCPVGSCGGSDATLATSTGPVTSASFAVTPGTYQCFRVQAVNDAGASGWSSYGCASTPGLTVPGAQMWTDSGISVGSGERLGLTAAGTIYVSGSDPGKPPAGDPNCLAAPSPPGTWVAPGLACWSLIARIGNGSPFEVGASTEVITTAGELYLGVNDNNFTDNSGSWTVRIKLGGMPPPA